MISIFTTLNFTFSPYFSNIFINFNNFSFFLVTPHESIFSSFFVLDFTFNFTFFPIFQNFLKFHPFVTHPFSRQFQPVPTPIKAAQPAQFRPTGPPSVDCIVLGGGDSLPLAPS